MRAQEESKKKMGKQQGYRQPLLGSAGKRTPQEVCQERERSWEEVLSQVAQGEYGATSPFLIGRAIRLYAGWLLRAEMASGKPYIEVCKAQIVPHPVHPAHAADPDITWRLVLCLSVQEARVTAVQLTLQHAAKRPQTREAEHAFVPIYEVGIMGIFHHGIEEAFGWERDDQEQHSPAMAWSPRTLRHLQGNPSDPLWKGIHWLCCNLLQWEAAGMFILPSESLSRAENAVEAT